MQMSVYLSVTVLLVFVITRTSWLFKDTQGFSAAISRMWHVQKGKFRAVSAGSRERKNRRGSLKMPLGRRVTRPPPLTCPQENAGKTPSRRRLDHPGFLAPPPRRSCTSYSAREKNRKWRGFTAYFFPGRISKLNSCSSTTPHDVAAQRARRAAITWFRVRIVTLRSYGVALSFFSALGSYATAPRSYNVALRSH